MMVQLARISRLSKPINRQSRPGNEEEVPDLRPWPLLPTELLLNIAALLPSNEAVRLRLVHRGWASSLNGPEFCTISLSAPVPTEIFAYRWSCPEAVRGLSVARRSQLVRLTAASGSLANLRVLLSRAGVALGEEAMTAAAAAGHLQACQWLQMEADCDLGPGVLVAAAEGGHRRVCEWLLANGCEWTREAACAAARSGHDAVFKWLANMRRGDHFYVAGYYLLDIAHGCSLAALQQLIQARLDRGWPMYPSVASAVLAASAASPTPDWQDKVVWLEGRGCRKTHEAACRVAEAPDAPARFDWLRPRHYPINGDAAGAAARAGNLDALKYLLGLGIVPTAAAARMAAEGGNVEALRVLDAAGCPVELPALEAAAKAGHLPAVQWLVRRLGGSRVLHGGVFAAALKSGHVGLLSWLLAHGCPWDADAVAASLKGSSEEQLEWLMQHGAPLGSMRFKPAVLRVLLRRTAARMLCLDVPPAPAPTDCVMQA